MGVSQLFGEVRIIEIISDKNIIFCFNKFFNNILNNFITYSIDFYNRPTRGPRSNFTSLTTQTIVINKQTIKNIDKLPLEYSYKFINILIL